MKEEERTRKTKKDKRFTCSLGSGKDQVGFSFSCHFIHIYSILSSREKFTDVHGCSRMRKVWKRISNIDIFNFHKINWGQMRFTSLIWLNQWHYTWDAHTDPRSWAVLSCLPPHSAHIPPWIQTLCQTRTPKRWRNCWKWSQSQTQRCPPSEGAEW